MNIFQKRIKPIENLTFIAIITAITVAFFAILNFVPFSFLVIILVFPFISFAVGAICKKRYFILYFLASFLLCLTFSFHDISNLLFYLVPSLITGFTMSILSNKKISIYYQVIVATIIQLCLTLLFVPVIELIYEINIIYDLVKLMGLNEYIFINSFIIPFALLISFIQSFISYIFIILFSIFPASSLSVSGSSTRVCIARFSGRAPYCLSRPRRSISCCVCSVSSRV